MIAVIVELAKTVAITEFQSIIQNLLFYFLCKGQANGVRYLRWGGDGEAVQPEK